MKKLNHLPFNDWLLSNAILTPEQDELLQDHLRNCVECRQTHQSLIEVSHIFYNSAQVEPLPGFSHRWQERYDSLQERHKKRNAWILFGVAGGMAILFLSMLFWSLSSLINSPVVVLTSLVYLWTYSQVFLKDMGQLLLISVKYLPTISALGILLFTGFSSMVMVLWIVTYRRLTAKRRDVTW